jgi:peptide/nickel transport system permease protein
VSDRRQPAAGPRALAGWLAARVGTRLIVLWGAATIAFLALRVVPSDPVASVLGGLPATPAIVRNIRADLGVGGSLPSDYLSYLAHLAQGNLGYSYQLNEPVSRAIGEQIGSTVALASTAMILGVAGGFLVALSTVGQRRRWGRRVANGVELAVISTPAFWLGILLLTVFSFQLHLFPVVGDTGGWPSLVLPALTLALPIAAVLSQLLRGELDRALAQPFILTARAHGLRESQVLWSHAMRHAALPAITFSGWVVGSLLSGAVLVETVFGRPGLGVLTQQAISNGDLPVVTGVVLLSAVVFVLINTAADVLYGFVDPRLRTR